MRRAGSPEARPCICGQSFSVKGFLTKSLNGGNNSLFNNGAGKARNHAQKNEIRHLPQFTYKVNSEWISLNVRAKAAKLSGENTEVNLRNLGFDNVFLDTNAKA